jgi:hypothetical protein
MKIYCASKARPAEITMWKALRGAGVPIAADWIDSPINGTNAEASCDMWARHWQKCLQQAAAADVTIFYAPEGATQCGSLIEIGSALQAGREVWIVSDYPWTIANHPRCRVFASIEACVAAIVARQDGEQLLTHGLSRSDKSLSALA